MKRSIAFLLAAVLFQQCGVKKTEPVSTVDSVAVDSASTTPAPTLLAFNAIEGFTLDKKFALDDSINFFLLSSQEDLVAKAGTSVTDPNFVINFILAVACKPTKQPTTLVMDKVELGSETIDVYFTKQTASSNPTQLFAIERRGGFMSMQVFVDGQRRKAFLLDALP